MTCYVVIIIAILENCVSIYVLFVGGCIINGIGECVSRYKYNWCRRKIRKLSSCMEYYVFGV